MFNMKKFLATGLALSMVIGATSLPTQALTKDELVSGVEYQLSTRNYSTNSMVANAYYGGAVNTYTTSFHPDAEVLVDEDEETFTLTLYIANDENIAFFNSIVTTGALYGSCHVEYDGIDYSGEILASYDNPLAPQKVFENEPSSGWVGMTAGETYGCDVITVSGIPVEALEDDGLKFDYALTSQFGNPMTMNQKLETGIVLDYKEKPEVEPFEEDKEVTITATKSTANAPSYNITIPTTVAVGDISSETDTTINYSIGLDLGAHESIAISVADSGSLTSGANSLAYTNTLLTKNYTANGSATGQLTVSKETAATAVAGDYTGTMTFNFTIT